MSTRHDAWSAGESYEHYMGRWSRLIAARYVEWLAPPRKADWLEVGCGTGALTGTILQGCEPRSILATDRSGDFVRDAERRLADSRVRCATAEAEDLPAGDRSIDIVASGLVLNFVPDIRAGLVEMQRVLRPGGILSFYVWDYPGGGMGFIDAFWKAAIAEDPGAEPLDEATRFPFCTEAGLVAICDSAGLGRVETAALEVRTEFLDFEAFWHPFTLGAGPAPGYLQSLDQEKRAALKQRLQSQLPSSSTVSLPARAWAVKAEPAA